jgi:hypothetical protein
LLVYTPGLYALVVHDQRRAGAGNVGNLDMDPICETCASGRHQDGRPQRHSKCALSFPEPRTIHAQLFLLWTTNGWRIDEVKADDLSSLRKLLR